MKFLSPAEQLKLLTNEELNQLEISSNLYPPRPPMIEFIETLPGINLEAAFNMAAACIRNEILRRWKESVK